MSKIEKVMTYMMDNRGVKAASGKTQTLAQVAAIRNGDTFTNPTTDLFVYKEKGATGVSKVGKKTLNKEAKKLGRLFKADKKNKDVILEAMKQNSQDRIDAWADVLKSSPKKPQKEKQKKVMLVPLLIIS